jgi:hypothetical protein
MHVIVAILDIIQRLVFCLKHDVPGAETSLQNAVFWKRRGQRIMSRIVTMVCLMVWLFPGFGHSEHNTTFAFACEHAQHLLHALWGRLSRAGRSSRPSCSLAILPGQSVGARRNMLLCRKLGGWAWGFSGRNHTHSVWRDHIDIDNSAFLTGMLPRRSRLPRSPVILVDGRVSKSSTLPPQRLAHARLQPRDSDSWNTFESPGTLD